MNGTHNLCICSFFQSTDNRHQAARLVYHSHHTQMIIVERSHSRAGTVSGSIVYKTCQLIGLVAARLVEFVRKSIDCCTFTFPLLYLGSN